MFVCVCDDDVSMCDNNCMVAKISDKWQLRAVPGEKCEGSCTVNVMILKLFSAMAV